MDTQPFRDRIGSQLQDILASDSAEGSFTTGGFAFTEDDLKTAIKNYLDIAKSYDDSINTARFQLGVEGPGLDYASASFATAANEAGQAIVRYLADKYDYCMNQAQLLQNALDDYLGIEHRNVTEMNKTDPQGPRPKV